LARTTIGMTDRHAPTNSTGRCPGVLAVAVRVSWIRGYEPPPTPRKTVSDTARTRSGTSAARPTTPPGSRAARHPPSSAAGAARCRSAPR